jgi:hypothetical protein
MPPWSRSDQVIRVAFVVAVIVVIAALALLVGPGSTGS